MKSISFNRYSPITSLLLLEEHTLGIFQRDRAFKIKNLNNDQTILRQDVNPKQTIIYTTLNKNKQQLIIIGLRKNSNLLQIQECYSQVIVTFYNIEFNNINQVSQIMLEIPGYSIYECINTGKYILILSSFNQISALIIVNLITNEFEYPFSFKFNITYINNLQREIFQLNPEDIYPYNQLNDQQQFQTIRIINKSIQLYLYIFIGNDEKCYLKYKNKIIRIFKTNHRFYRNTYSLYKSFAILYEIFNKNLVYWDISNGNMIEQFQLKGRLQK